MLLYSLIVLIISISLMWYGIRNAVTNPVLRPRLVGTPGRMALLNLTRLLTTALGVADADLVRRRHAANLDL